MWATWRNGPVSAITSSVDGVESMQVYYSQYLPGLFYSLLAPIYLFFQLWKVSLRRRCCCSRLLFATAGEQHLPPPH